MLMKQDGIKISIHAPRVGSDVFVELLFYFVKRFQSTLPVWGATSYTRAGNNLTVFQSTLPVWGATHNMQRSVHNVSKFQSTLPVWGATFKVNISR